MNLRDAARELVTASGGAGDAPLDEIAMAELDSLLVMELVVELEHRIGRPVPEAALVTWRTVGDLVRYGEAVGSPA